MDRREVGFSELVRQLGRWDGRRRKVEALLWMPRAILAGLLIATIVAGIARLYPYLLNRDIAYLTLALSLAGLAISGIIIFLRKRSVIDQAYFADRHFYLQERMSTAVEIHEGRIQTDKPIAKLQLDDSLQRVVAVDTNHFLPLKISRRDIILILLSAGLLVAAIVLPNPAASALAEKRTLEKAIADEVETLRALVQEIDQETTLTTDQRRQLSSALQEALERLERDNVSREQAVATLSEASAELRALSETNDTASLEQSLHSVEQSLMASAVGRSLGQALSSTQLDVAAKIVSQFAESLSELDPTEVADLASALTTMADSLETADPELASDLASAAEALAGEDLSAAQVAMNSAAATLEKRARQGDFANRANDTADELAQGRQVIAQAGQAAMDSNTSGGEEQSGQGQQGQPGIEVDEGAEQATPLKGGSVGGTSSGGGHAERIYVPPPADLTSEEGVDVVLPAECSNSPGNCGFLISESPSPFGNEQSLVPYDQVFSDYRNTAYQALESDYIPLNLRSFVRDYFSSLEPE